MLDQSVARTDRTGRILGLKLGTRDFLTEVPDRLLDDFEASPNMYLTDAVGSRARRQLQDAIRECLETGRSVQMEFTTGATGRRLHLAATCTPCGPDEVLWAVRDLTPQHDERRAAKERAELESMINDCLHSLIDTEGEPLHLALESTMQRIGVFFGANRAFLRRFRDADHVEVVCQWRASHVRTTNSGTSLAGSRAFPWASRQLARHPVLVVSDMDDLGPEAATDLTSLNRTGDRGLVWVRTGPPRRPTGLFGLVFDDTPLRDAPDVYEPIIGLADTMLALVDRSVDAARRETQHRVFELVARGTPLHEVLTQVCRLRETGHPGQHCVIWLADDEGRLRPIGSPDSGFSAAAPESCPPDTPEAVAARDGVSGWWRRGPNCGSLGTMADRWGANALGVTPLRSVSRGRVTGVLAVYDTSADPVDLASNGTDSGDVAASLATIAIERVADLEEMSHRATHDALTGLANRITFLDRVSAALERPTSVERLAAVLYCDVDRFKEMNDRLGHATGDLLLVEVGRCIAAQGLPAALVARLGGDEFAVLLEDLADEDEALAVAERIRRAVREMRAPVEPGVTVSIGVAVTRSGTDHADGLLRDADMAMYQAKSGGRDRVEMYRERFRRQAQERDHLARELAAAIVDRRIEVHFQPMLELTTLRLTGFEALARWHDDALGAVSPGTFVSIAESSGLITELGDAVLEMALDVAQDWDDLDLHVNLSARQIDAPGGIDRLLDRVTTSVVPAERIAMEITESVLLSETSATFGNLAALLDVGIGLVLDDFGTGYASLTYLRRFPFRGIKVDQSFVAGMTGSADDATIVAMVLALAASLGLDVVAEGVETTDQEELLRQMGCARVQGFRYSPRCPQPRYRR